MTALFDSEAQVELNALTQVFLSRALQSSAGLLLRLAPELSPELERHIGSLVHCMVKVHSSGCHGDKAQSPFCFGLQLMFEVL